MRDRAAPAAVVELAEFVWFHQPGRNAQEYLHKPTSVTRSDGRLLQEWIDWMGAPLAPAGVLAAQRCFKVHETIAARERIGQTLLRASAAPETAPGTLLRPASGDTAAQLENLLRASIGSENQTE